MKSLVVINPASGGGKGASIGAKVRNVLTSRAQDFEVVQAPSLEESLKEIENLCAHNRFDHLICVGGDGLIHDLIPHVIKYEIPLLVVPAGTGNDFARTIGTYGKKIEDILQIPTEHSPAEIDVGLIKSGSYSVPFVQILSTGFDSVVNARANNFRFVKGTIKYVVAVLLEVWKFKAVDFTLTIDGKLITQKAMLVCVANGTSYGAGMKIVPHANHQDRMLDVMVVDHVNPLRLLLVFPRVFFGTHIKHPKVHFYSGESIEINGDTQAYADGEHISALPIHVTLSDKPLQVFKA